MSHIKKTATPLERGSGGDDRRSGEPRDSATRRRQQDALAVITKSGTAQVRIFVTEWRGQRKIEIREYTAVIPRTYFQSGGGITLPLDKADELVAAIRRAVRR